MILILLGKIHNVILFYYAYLHFPLMLDMKYF